MNKVRILTDSCADLTAEMYEKYDIDFLCQTVRFGENVYKDDGKEITLEQLYQLVKDRGELPHTSAVPLGDFDAYFKKNIEEGYDIVYVGLGSKLSTTFQNAHIAKQSYPDDRIYLVDSMSLSSGIGLLVLKACKYRDEGLSAKEIAEKVSLLAPKTIAQFTVDTLDYLHKGGRCSGASKLIGHIFHVDPYLRMVDGSLIVYKKPRGPAKIAFDEQVKELKSALPNVDLDHIMITHAGLDKDKEDYIKGEVSKLVPPEIISVTRAGGVIASHCGYGTVGILYILK